MNGSRPGNFQQLLSHLCLFQGACEVPDSCIQSLCVVLAKLVCLLKLLCQCSDLLLVSIASLMPLTFCSRGCQMRLQFLDLLTLGCEIRLQALRSV